ncbi:MAG: hypothetical protein LUI87_02110 [Lachnospiraceae bacterium]|nr:hypothetical protein [Lachnospiraceae bacterium]
MNFDDIHLLPEEKRSLFTFIFQRQQPAERIKCFQSLYYEYQFIIDTSEPDIDQDGFPIYKGIYSISDQYRRYKIYRREKRIHDLPNWIAITISLIGLIGNAFIELWRLGLL